MKQMKKTTWHAIGNIAKPIISISNWILNEIVVAAASLFRMKETIDKINCMHTINSDVFNIPLRTVINLLAYTSHANQ